MNDFINALKTNENNARTKTLIVAGITVATIGLGLYLSQKNAPTPMLIVVDEVVETVADAAQ